MKHKVLTTRRLPEAVERRLAETYDVVLAKTDDGLSAADLAAAMRDFDALCPSILDRIGAARSAALRPSSVLASTTS